VHKISRVSPDLNIYLADFRDCDPETMPWTASQGANFATWRARVLAEVPNEILEDAMSRLSKRLEGLQVSDSGCNSASMAMSVGGAKRDDLLVVAREH
jgi:hypothetical protein